jgi:hypothetical protein
MKTKNDVLNELAHNKNDSEFIITEILLDVRDQIARLADTLERNEEIKKINV